MPLELRQSLKLQQQLIMTPQLQQAIKLLQLSRLELAEVIQQEMTENPVLEELPEAVETPEEERERADQMEGYDESAPAAAPMDDADRLANLIKNLDRKSFEGHPGSYVDDDRADLEPTLQKAETLSDHLMEQLGLSDFEPELEAACALLIGNLDENGYLVGTLADLARQNRVDPDTLEVALDRVQEMDPVGVGARDLRECLLLQIEARGWTGTPVEKVIRDHLGDLEKRNFKAIAAALKVPLPDLAKVLKQIESLEPKPGRPFGGQPAQYITPDIYVIKVGDEYIVQLNDDGLPKLRISNYYRKILENRAAASDLDREYIQDKVRAAVWLIRSIHQRQRTIFRVTESIVRFQREFLDRGVAHLRPLILRDVAEDIGMHESTISRVTTNKYVHTPQGIFELKYFFNSGIASDAGDTVASESVKDAIRHLVSAENAEKPYSDQEIVDLLARQGIRIARRTVTKYREMLGILSSTKRRKLF
jgi:RNA polymerase sigma-54 factor